MEQIDLYLLQQAPPYHLQAISKARHLAQPVKSKGNPASEASASSAVDLDELGERLFDPAACQEAILDLGELDMRILSELTACGGRANSRDLALYLQSAGAFPTSKTGQAGLEQKPAATSSRYALEYPVPHPHGLFEQAVHRLLLHGLLFWGRHTNFVGRDYASGVYDGVLIVPQAVMNAMRSIDASRLAQEHSLDDRSEEAREAHLPVYPGEGIRELQRSLYRYWSLVAAQRDGLALVSSKLLSRSALRQVVEQLSPTVNVEHIRTEADLPRLLFMRLLLMKLGLLYERNSAIYHAPAADYFSLPLVERARRCYHLWRDTSFWNELNYLPDVLLRPGPAPVDPAHAEVAHSRAMLMQRLLQEQPGTARAFTSFIARSKLSIPYLLFPREPGARAERYSVGNNPYGWDFRLKHGWLTHREGWYLVEGGFIRTALSGPLCWLGLVEVDEQAGTFTLVPSIEAIAAENPPPIAGDVWGRLVVQPNFELVALAPVSEALLLTLDRFAELVRLEQIAQYRLTRASVTRAVQMGMQAPAMQQVLEQAAGGAIPQNVVYSLAEWERQARRIELWPSMTIIEVESEALLDELYADEGARACLGRRFSPTLAQVMTARLADVRELLWQRAFLPAQVVAPAYAQLLEGGRMLAHEAQWRLQAGGLLQPCYPVLNLYLTAELERFTTLDEQTGWRRITPASIQQAIGNRVPLDAIVRFLQLYCEGGLLPSFLIRLKLWGNGYRQQDTIQVESLPMLRLSAQALRDIQADEELGALLDAELPTDSRLVRVPHHNLARVLEVLRERGFTVTTPHA